MSTFYRIAWRNLTTGQTGAGKKVFDTEQAQTVCDELNADYGDNFEHTLQPVDSAGKPSEEAKFKSAPLELPKPFTPLADTDSMPFGEFKGMPMNAVPSSRLDFLSGNSELMAAWPQVADYIQRNRKSINEDLEREAREAL